MDKVICRLGWLICGFMAVCELALKANTSSDCFRKSCHGIAYDSREAVCCGNQLHNGAGLSCCGDQPYNPATASCCKANVTPGLSQNVSSCCGLTAYNDLNELCCGGKIQAMHSFSHRCCSHHQYNFMNECCYWDVNGSPGTPKPKDSEFCPATSGIQDKKNAAQPHCTEPKTHLCGSHCYDPNKHRCCERKRASGQHDAALYDPDTHVCCDGHVKPGMGQCCGETQPGVFCCNKDREDGEECSDTSIPYNPAKGTICSSQFHGSPGQHCCGTEIYQPGNEICCDGHRYPKEGNVQCCGIKAYNMKDPKMKCCAGTLYNLTDPEYSRDVECCGSVLRNPQEQEVCCSSMDQAVLYSGKTGFSCCGHLYFNMSLWSCSAECLSPVQQPGQQEEKMTGCRLESVNNLNETALCGEIYIGIVQSVSPNSIVFNFVLKINGTNADVRPVPFHYVLATPSRCSTPKLILGKFYFFNDVSVFADFNHDTALQSLYFILDKCSP